MFFNKKNQENSEFTREELQDILTGVKELSMDDLAKVFGGRVPIAGDEREEYTLDEKEIYDDIYIVTDAEAIKTSRDLARKVPITLHAELDEFSILFALYLDTISTDFDKNVNHDFINSCEYAINFNYTNFLSKYYEENNVVLLDCVSINGSVNEDKSLCPIVFGVSNETNFKNQDFNMFKKNLQRSINSTRIGHLANILSEYYNSIVIFGHSLSKSDLDTFASIFKKLLSDPHIEFGPSIYIFYLDQESKKNLVLNIERILNRVKDNLFNEYQIFDKLIFVKAPSN